MGHLGQVKGSPGKHWPYDLAQVPATWARLGTHGSDPAPFAAALSILAAPPSLESDLPQAQSRTDLHLLIVAIGIDFQGREDVIEGDDIFGDEGLGEEGFQGVVTGLPNRKKTQVSTASL
jgi:hypothetical protein